MRKILFLLIISLLILPLPIYAACPVCTAGLGAGIGLLIFFGYDELFIGLVLGAFVIFFSNWLNLYLHKKNINKKYQQFVVIIFSFVFFTAILYSLKILGIFFQQYNAFNILIFSMFMGSLFFYAFSGISIYLQTALVQGKISKGKLLTLLIVLVVIAVIFFNLMEMLTKMIF